MATSLPTAEVSTPWPRRVLALVAHPDDVEFMAGGLVSTWARAGVELHYAITTDGQGGTMDPAMTRERLGELRRQEQRAAAELAGVRSIAFLGYEDGALTPNQELRLRLARLIRVVRPDALLTMDPTAFFGARHVNHPDHRAVGEAALAAVWPLSNVRLAAPVLDAEGLEPHTVSEIYLTSPAQPTRFFPLDEERFRAKVLLLAAHASQFGPGLEELLRRLASDAAERARAAGVDCTLAEEFSYVRMHG